MKAFPLSDYPTLSPLGLYATLKQKHPTTAIMLLESAVLDESNRISIVACEPVQTIEVSKNIQSTIQSAQKACHTFADNPYFSGGLMGSLTFESVFDFFPKYQSAHHETLPRTLLYEFGNIYIFDHAQNILLSLHHPNASVHSTETLLSTVLPRNKKITEKTLINDKNADADQSFRQMVQKAQSAIANGEVFQLVLSKAFQTPVKNEQAIDVYQSLKALEPTTHLILADYGIHGVYTCASPEIIGKKNGNQLLVSPIAGTRKRKKSQTENHEIAQNLLHDPKENAEHDMLVDLGRNDLGRVSLSGTVAIQKYKYIQAYKHVIHLLSDITATIKPNYDVTDFLKSIFPAGTLSGAPKIRAVKLIQDFEPTARGLYGGATGIIETNGNMQMAINIRGVHIQNNIGTVQVGAGIVKDSVPLHEWYELQNKSRTLRNILNQL